ncbi:MAG TPA: Cro/Cl family transcriptional regulator [Cyanobacteria bacterium UBA9971]|nr:Cro/Cl family transcriptional regulator [Cyanobacteria bacterium UBA9971]
MINNKLSEILGKKRIRMSELQKMTGLSHTTIISLYYARSKNISFETIDKLCEALECNIQELFEYIPN